MALKWGSTTLGSNTNITFDGQNVTKIYYNNVLVWEKVNTCTTCNGTGTISRDCPNCKGGTCEPCAGAGYTNVMCDRCMGYDVCWYCNACGTRINISSFIGSDGILDEAGIPYRCGKCGAYYKSMDYINNTCSADACPYCTDGYNRVTCTNCNGTGKCPYCDNGYIIQTCPTCNGSGSASGGSSSSD